MADSLKLKRFHIEHQDDAFLLRIEDEGGGSYEVSATHDQIDLILDSLDDALDDDEEAETVEGDEDEDEGQGGPKG